MLDEALRQLCSTPRSFLGVFAMTCIILGVLLHVANYLINSGKPETLTRPFLRLGGTGLLALAAMCILVYVLAPPMASLLLGKDPTASDCTFSEPVPPYCGAYCTNRTIAPAYENCTCIMY